MVTREQVKKAKEQYLALRRQYHQEQSTTIRLMQSEDGYRGHLTCLRFLDQVEFTRKGDGLDGLEIVKKNGVPVGELSSCYGNYGTGSLASQSFDRYPGVTVEWYSRENPEFLIERIQDENGLHQRLSFRGKESNDIPNIVCFLWDNDEGWEVELGVDNSQAEEEEELCFLIKTKEKVDWTKMQLRLGEQDFPVVDDGYVFCSRKQLQGYFERNLGVTLIIENQEIALVYRGQV